MFESIGRFIGLKCNNYALCIYIYMNIRFNIWLDEIIMPLCMNLIRIASIDSVDKRIDGNTHMNGVCSVL